MSENVPTFAAFVFLVGFVWTVHRVLNNKINKSSGRIDGRVNNLEKKLEEKVVALDVFESYKETIAARHETLEKMQKVLRDSLKESAVINGRDHERLMESIAEQSRLISKLPVLIQTTIQNTLKND